MGGDLIDHGERSDLLWWVLVKDVERENTPYDVARWFSEQKKGMASRQLAMRLGSASEIGLIF